MPANLMSRNPSSVNTNYVFKMASYLNHVHLMAYGKNNQSNLTFFECLIYYYIFIERLLDIYCNRENDNVHSAALYLDKATNITSLVISQIILIMLSSKMDSFICQFLKLRMILFKNG